MTGTGGGARWRWRGVRVSVACAIVLLVMLVGHHQDLALSIIKGQSREEGLMQAYLDLWYGGGMGPMGGMGH